MKKLESWETMVLAAREAAKDTTPVVKCTRSDSEMRREFFSGFGGMRGVPFTVWTEKRVYFPVCYDGSEWVDSVPRDPCDEHTYHVGG